MVGKLRIRHVDRAQDDRLLLWLYWYDQGYSYAEIGRHSGVSYQTVAQYIKQVFDAEEQEKAVDA